MPARVYFSEKEHALVGIVRNPEGRMADELEQGHYQITLTSRNTDLSLQKKLGALNSIHDREPAPLDEFDLTEVLTGRTHRGRHSRDFLLEWEYQADHLPVEEADATRKSIFELYCPSTYIDRQGQAMHLIVRGTKTGMVIVEGIPGAGKTTIEGRAGLIFAAMGKKVLFVAPSNTAVDEIVVKLFELIPTANLDHMKQKILRLYSQSVEAQLSREVEALAFNTMLLEDEERVGPNVNVDERFKWLSIARKAQHYLSNDGGSAPSEEYFGHRSARARNVKLDYRPVAPYVSDHAPMSYEESSEKVEKILFDGASIVVCTLDVALKLFAEATSPTFIMALCNQEKLQQVVLFGDTLQLSPTVTSPKGVDPMAFRLKVSIQERLMRSCTSIPVVYLNEDLRRVDGLIDLFNHAIYKGRIKGSVFRKVLLDTTVGSSTTKAFSSHFFLRGSLRSVADFPAIFVNVTSIETFDKKTKSYKNPQGVAACRRICEALLQIDHVRSEDVLMATYYSADVKHMRSELADTIRAAEYLRIKTCDASQGTEAEVYTRSEAAISIRSLLVSPETRVA
jgi:hypothetical protein